MFIITFAFLVIGNLKKINESSISYTVPKLADITEEQKTWLGNGDNYWIGAAEPDIIMVEFADFSCPYCRQSFGKVREVVEKYNKNVKLIFRDYPILSEESTDLALVARCAGEQGLFWPMHDKLFLNQGIAKRSDYIEIAKQIGADLSRFASCFDSRKYYGLIEKDLNDGAILDITGTPTFFINGQKIPGSIPFEIMEKIFNDTLNN